MTRPALLLMMFCLPALADEGEVLIDAEVGGGVFATAHPRADYSLLSPGTDPSLSTSFGLGLRYGVTNSLSVGLALSGEFSPLPTSSPDITVQSSTGVLVSQRLAGSAAVLGGWRYDSLAAFSGVIEARTGVHLSSWGSQFLLIPDTAGTDSPLTFDVDPEDDLAIAWLASLFAAVEYRPVDEVVVAIGPTAAVAVGAQTLVEVGARLRVSWATSLWFY